MTGAVGQTRCHMGWEEEHRQRVERMPADIRDAHAHCGNHRAEILSSATCGCFYCCATFRSGEVLDWVDEDEHEVGQTAVCPKCGIDSVIGDRAGYELSAGFLGRMQAHWF